MKRNLWVPALILVVLVAAGALWRLRGSRSAARPAPATGAELGHAHGAGHTPIDEPELREGPPRVIAEDDPAGSLRLEGQVLDDAEHPVAEAVVSLASAPPRQARTAADGTFAFDGLLARPYTLAARAPSGVAGPVTARLTAKSDPVVLRLRPGAQVHVEVVDARQQPVAVATVELRGVSEQSAQTKDGKVTFAPVVPGPYQAVAWADGYARAYLPAMIGAGTTALRIELARGAPVSGKVVDERGAPVAGARVRYDAASDFGPGATGGTGHRDAVTTTADGAFTFASLPAGSFRFLASHPEFATGISSLVALSGESAKTDVEIAMPAGAVVSGKVVDDRGKPVDAARVRIGVAQAGFRFSSPPREAYSNAAGEFTVRGLPRRELSAVALHESGASSTQLVDAQKGEVTGVLLTVDATGTIAGVVVDSSGQPVESAQVSAVPDIFGRRGRGAAGSAAPAGDGPAGGVAQWQLRGFPQELTDAEGRFQLTGLLPGSYRVRATRSAAVSRGRGLAGDGVVAEAGAKNLRVVLPAEGSVRGKVAFADGSAPDRFTVALGFAQQSFSGGELLLDSLTPQRYQLVLRGASFEMRVLEAEVLPGKTTDLGTIVVVKGRRLSGVVLAEGKPVGGATVFAGSQIMGSGSSNSGMFGGRGGGMGGVKEATTGADGTFSLEGFADVDLTVVAEHATLGRSRALTWGTGSGQDVVRLTLLPFGSVRGQVVRAGKPAEGVMVIAQSVSAAAAMYTVASGADGAFRFDRLAPDVYKVSATVGMPMTGMKQYSKQVEVASGKEVAVELAVEPGTVTLETKVTAAGQELGLVGWVLAPGHLTAATAKELRARTATSGAGTSQFGMGQPPFRIGEVAPGTVSVCLIPYPRELDSMMRVLTYAERHGEKLAVSCKVVEVRAAPATQPLELSVTVPALLADEGGPGGPGAPQPPAPK